MSDFFNTDDVSVDPIKKAMETKKLAIHDISLRGRTPAVSFGLNSGQGYGNQVIPVDELDGMIEALQTFAENIDIIPLLEDENQPRYTPTYQVMSERICRIPIKHNGQDTHGIVLYSRTGRGIKPNVIPVDKFNEYVEFVKKIRVAVNKKLSNPE